MKKIALIAMTAAAAIATPAMAQSTTSVTGTIDITGAVAAKCYVGTDSAQKTFAATVAMEELANADGTLKDSATLAAKFATAGGVALATKVVCNGAAPNVTVTADPLKHSAVTDANLPTGYNNTVNYTANVKFTLATGTDVTVSDLSGGNSSAQSLATALSTASGTNVAVTTSDWTAPGVLVAGDYAGKITILVKPTV